MGYEQYGDAWADRDNLAESLPEIADALVYLFQAVLSGEVRTLNMGNARAALSDTWMHLTALQRAIRWGEGDKLQELFTRTRAIRRSIIDARQA